MSDAREWAPIGIQGEACDRGPCLQRWPRGWELRDEMVPVIPILKETPSPKALSWDRLGVQSGE